MARFILIISLAFVPAVALAAAPDFARDVAPVFKKYCEGCHNDAAPEGEFSLDSFASLQKGTPDGPALLAGDADASRMVRMMTGAAEPVMPPEGEARPSDEEIALIKSWIDAGAKGPEGESPRMNLIVPKIAPAETTGPVTAMDASPDGKLLAVARFGKVELYDISNGSLNKPVRVLANFPGKVTAVHFTSDGAQLVTASGVVGLGGVAAIWSVEDGSLEASFEDHRDILYDAELSPDGEVLATCSYDKSIILRRLADGRVLHTLAGHNGAVYDVAFSADGQFLVSASADDTCKVWRVSDGARLDTLGQPLKEAYACLFSPDGKHIVSAGADNNIRVWKFISKDKPRVNPMAKARFAHEGPIVRMAFTRDGSKLVSLAEDRTIKVWETSGYTEVRLWENQPDVATALAVTDNDAFYVGRMDGSLVRLDLPSIKPKTSDATATVAKADPMEDMGDPAKVAEQEPNSLPEKANAVSAPVEISGVIDSGDAKEPDVDLFRFSAAEGQQWVVEVNASRSKSKLDSFVEILDAKGERIQRVLLQAVRDSYFTFRGKNDTTSDDFRVFNWEEMGLNDYLYANGEVNKLWLHPRGPDSGFMVYPGQGARWGWFDTTPLSHALGEPCYVVRAHPPGSEIIPNGLPVFPIYYENDDDSRRKLQKDSRVFFTAPADGDYLVRIKDVRGFGGADYSYKLMIRPRQPDFKVTLHGAGPTVNAGGARQFRVTADRIDRFDGPIRVNITGLPPGFSVTSPVIIEAGQIEAMGVIWAAKDAPKPTPENAKATNVVATATPFGQEAQHEVNNFGEIKLGPPPKVTPIIERAEGGALPIQNSPGAPLAFEVERGETIMLKVRIERNGFDGRVTFGKEGAGRNLPFGVYIDNLGLNGLMIHEKQTEQTFFITADVASEPQTQLFHIRTGDAGGQASLPVLLHVR